MKKSLSMLLAGAMLVSALAGCGGNTSSSSETSSTDESTASGTAFKVGGTAPLTGTAAIYGNAVKNGAELAAERSTPRAATSSSKLSLRTTRTTPRRPSARTTH